MKDQYATTGNRIAALLLALLLTALCAPAALAEETPAELDNGVTWETTLAQVKELEGVADDEDLDTYSDGDFTQYSFLRPTAEDEPVTYVYYIYRNEQLVMYGTGMISGEDDLTALFDAQYAPLVERYGEPSDQDKAWFVGMFDLLEEGTIDEEMLVGYEAWDLGGDTKLCLTNANNESIVRVYINAAGMTSEANE